MSDWLREPATQWLIVWVGSSLFVLSILFLFLHNFFKYVRKIPNPPPWFVNVGWNLFVSGWVFWILHLLFHP